MAAEEERRARAVLAEMQMRISQGPHAALSVPETATAEDVRAAFLQLTKQFHPARFGRMSGEIHRLANEVFLGIKGAHDQLTKVLGSSGRRPPQPSGSGVFVPPSTGNTERGTGLVPRATSPSTGGQERGIGLVARATSPAPVPPTQLARGTDRASQVHSTPNVAAGMPRALSPLVTPLTARPGAQPSSGPGATPPLGVATRPASPSPTATTHARRGTPSPSSRPTAPMSRIGTPPPRPGSPPLRPGSPPSDALDPPTIRYSGAQPAAPLGGAFDEQRELAAAMDLLGAGDWSAARQALHALAAKLPQSRHYRALLCYARGRETQASGRVDDAVLEFQRALQLDPELEIAKQALRDLGRKSRW